MSKFELIDRFANFAAELRPKSTAINPRYCVRNVETHEIYDEFTTKRPAADTVRDLNREASA